MSTSKSPVVNGTWTHQTGDAYLVTGTDRDNKKFRMEFKDWPQAQGINVWRGTKWLIRDGKRYIIQRIYN